MSQAPPLTHSAIGIARKRFGLALAASAALHVILLAASAPWRKAPEAAVKPAPIEARLLPKAADSAAAEQLLKDTLAREQSPPALPPPPPNPAPAKAHQPSPVPASKSPDQAEALAQRKLARHIYYPPEAVARRLEGEVRVLLVLDAEGRVSDATLAASSGHAILDEAAIKAVVAMGRLPGLSDTELILPVVFRLR